MDWQQYWQRYAGLVLAVGGVVGLIYMGMTDWYVIKQGVTVVLPKVIERVEVHDHRFDQVGEAITKLTDAALVEKARMKARRVECLKLKQAANGALDGIQCPEPEE